MKKEWIQYGFSLLTPIMVLFLSLELEEKRDHDKELLDEVKNIKTAINKSAVIFGKIEIKIDNLEKRVTKIEEKIER